MKYRYLICDVFTRTRFGGNQLAVLPEAEGLDTARMQQIAREFNFSESTFVFPSEDPFDRKVRIFTPSIEVPFAGHPNVGTAFALTVRDSEPAQIHVTEEARHLSFARAFLRRNVPHLSGPRSFQGPE